MPNGLKGVLMVGILSVAMSTLSSSINSLSSSTINDWFPNLNNINSSKIATNIIIENLNNKNDRN